MLKDFLEKKKYLIEFSGVVITITALFLNINIPVDNEIALESLLFVQFLFLLMSSILIFTLFIHFFIFIASIEKFLETDKKFNTVAVTSIFGVLFMNIITHLWIYMVSLYGIQFKNFVSNIQVFFSTGLVSVFIKILGIVYRWKNKADFLYVAITYTAGCFLIVLNSFWLEMASLKFSLLTFKISFYSINLIFSVFFVILLLVNYFFERKYNQSVFKDW